MLSEEGTFGEAEGDHTQRVFLLYSEILTQYAQTKLQYNIKEFFLKKEYHPQSHLPFNKTTYFHISSQTLTIFLYHFYMVAPRVPLPEYKVFSLTMVSFMLIF